MLGNFRISQKHVHYNLRDFWVISREPLMKTRWVTPCKAWLRVDSLIYQIEIAIFNGTA